MWGLVGKQLAAGGMVGGDIPVADRSEGAAPNFIGSAIWDHAWSNHRVVCHCDNQAVVACLRSRTSKHPTLIHLLRNLVNIEARSGFYLYSVYIDTHANHIADDLISIPAS